MKLKNTLKSLKLNESTISMVLGALVIIVVGMLVINYFRDMDRGDIATSVNDEKIETTDELPTTHTVNAGETLWMVAERYYGSGYNWVDIAQENEITSADSISAGQVLTIPDVESRQATITETETVTENNDSEVTSSPTVSPTATIAPTITEAPQNEESIRGESYTVVAGDTLWHIAERAYGDPYRWVDIARANEMANPDLIFVGTQINLPR